MSLRIEPNKNKNFSKIGNREKLLNMLYEYRNIITKNMYEYLKSLIELEVSIIKEEISNEDRKVLSELNIYRKIEIYNIMSRAINIFSKDEHPFYIEEKGENEKYVYYKSSNGSNKEVFSYKYPEDTRGCLLYKGIILYQTKNDKRTLNSLYKLYKKQVEETKTVKNPYLECNDLDFAIKSWEKDHADLLSIYEDSLNRIIDFKESDSQKKERMIVNNVCHEFITDYGLKKENICGKEINMLDDCFKKSLKYQKANTNIMIVRETNF